MYLDYILRKNYQEIDEVDYNLAKAQQLQKLPEQDKNKMSNKINELFSEGMLSGTLSDEIDERLKTLPVLPTIEEIKEAEMAVFGNLANGPNLENIEDDDDVFILEEILSPSPSPQKSPTIFDELIWDPDNEGKKEEVENDFIYFSANPLDNPPDLNFLSPIVYTGMIDIDNLLYPTISHYITTFLLSKLPSINNINNAYKYILVNPNNEIKDPESFINIDGITNIYMDQKEINYITSIKHYATIGLIHKFKDIKLQDLLILTGNGTIVYNDFSDPILGVGNQNRGENFIGGYLMELRTKIYEERKGDDQIKVSVNDISKLVESDLLLKSWVQTRVKDMSHVIIAMKSYFHNKYGVDKNIDKDFVVSVLDNIYHNCAALDPDSINIETPYWFDDLIKKQPGMTNSSYDVIKTIWDRLIVILYYLMISVKDQSLYNMKLTIANIEHIASQNKVCRKIIENPYDNCILSALLNIMKGMDKITNQDLLDTYDIKTAASILLNRDIDELIMVIPDELDAGMIALELNKISQQYDIDELVPQMYGMVIYIKDYKISHHKKNIRINLFAN